VLLGVLVIAAVGWRIWIWHGVPAAIGHSSDPAVRFHNGVLIAQAWARWYFGTFSRVDGLLVGALAAILVTGTRRRAAMLRRPGLLRGAVAVGVAVAVAVVVRADTESVSTFVPLYGLLPLELGIAAVVVGLLLLPESFAARVFGLAPMVWIGRRSYAMYMLHIPVWMFVAHFGIGRRLSASSPRAATGWIALAMTFGVAALSFRFVEKPAMALKGRLTGRG
jgi:peptidoglycan/LPS O-acetylase OafA/YrhL